MQISRPAELESLEVDWRIWVLISSPGDSSRSYSLAHVALKSSVSCRNLSSNFLRHSELVQDLTSCHLLGLRIPNSTLRASPEIQSPPQVCYSSSLHVPLRVSLNSLCIWGLPFFPLVYLFYSEFQDVSVRRLWA